MARTLFLGGDKIRKPEEISTKGSSVELMSKFMDDSLEKWLQEQSVRL